VEPEVNVGLTGDEDVEQRADAIPSYIYNLYQFNSVPDT